MDVQKDWTKPLDNEPETFPGSLRGYRHFGYPFKSGSNATSVLCSVYSKYEYPVISQEEWWEATCGTSANPSTTSFHPVVPAKTCKCGFYLNYYPQTSFYDKEKEQTYPRGVVEASGYLVLSQKGFRAQKTRLVAISPLYMRFASYIAEKFPWVEIFETHEEMYEAFPQDDLTSLIGEEAVNRNLNPSLGEELKQVQPLSFMAAPYSGSPNLYNSTQYHSNWLKMVQSSMATPGRLMPGSTVWPLTVVTHCAPHLTFTGGCTSGMKVTCAPGADFIRVERHTMNYNPFDYSQMGNPYYLDPVGGRDFMQEVKITDLKVATIEVAMDGTTMLGLSFIYQNFRYDFNFVTGEADWRRTY